MVFPVWVAGGFVVGALVVRVFVPGAGVPRSPVVARLCLVVSLPLGV